MSPSARYGPHHWPHYWPQTGLTLIELMIAMTLGLMITTSLGYILMGSRSTYRTQDASARVQDTGRFALEFIGRQLRSAGRTVISPGNTLLPSVPTPIAGTDTTLTVQYQDSDMGKKPDDIRDCNGNGENIAKTVIPDTKSANKYATVSNTISFDGNEDKKRQLRCEGNGGGGSQPFAEGVEELQFRYTMGDGTWTTAPGNPVVAVEVCFRVRSTGNGVVNATQTIKDCAGNDFTPKPADTRLRRTFTSVFALRNNIHSLPTP